MPKLSRIYENIEPNKQIEITQLLNEIEAEIEKYLRGEKLEEGEEILSQRLANINQAILEKGRRCSYIY